jgi:hypothetical protein
LTQHLQDGVDLFGREREVNHGDTHGSGGETMGGLI